MSANNNTNSSSGTTAATEGNATIGSSSISHESPQTPTAKAKDPFFFYSNRENLQRARSFQEIDYSTEDSLRGTTLRKTRISFEMDAVSLMMDMLLQDENWKIFIVRTWKEWSTQAFPNDDRSETQSLSWFCDKC